MMKSNACNSRSKTSAVICFMKLFVLLFGFWILISGELEKKFIWMGLITALITAVLFMPMMFLRTKNEEMVFVLNLSLWKLILYSMWLIKEIFKSSIETAIVVLCRKKEQESQIVYFYADYDNPIATAILANSITLTPGTITLAVSEDGIFEVHALTKRAAYSLLEGSMQHKVAWLCKQEDTYQPFMERTLYLNSMKAVSQGGIGNA